MPRQRWRNEVLAELRAIREGGERHEAALRETGARHDALIRETAKRHDALIRETAEGHDRLIRETAERHDRLLGWLGEQNRDSIRDMKASVEWNAEVTERCMETLAGLTVRNEAVEARMKDMTDHVGAQTEALLALIDEIRGSNGSIGHG